MTWPTPVHRQATRLTIPSLLLFFFSSRSIAITPFTSASRSDIGSGITDSLFCMRFWPYISPVEPEQIQGSDMLPQWHLMLGHQMVQISCHLFAKRTISALAVKFQGVKNLVRVESEGTLTVVWPDQHTGLAASV